MSSKKTWTRPNAVNVPSRTRDNIGRCCSGVPFYGLPFCYFQDLVFWWNTSFLVHFPCKKKRRQQEILWPGAGPVTPGHRVEGHRQAIRPATQRAGPSWGRDIPTMQHSHWEWKGVGVPLLEFFHEVLYELMEFPLSSLLGHQFFGLHQFASWSLVRWFAVRHCLRLRHTNCSFQPMQKWDSCRWGAVELVAFGGPLLVTAFYRSAQQHRRWTLSLEITVIQLAHRQCMLVCTLFKIGFECGPIIWKFKDMFDSPKSLEKPAAVAQEAEDLFEELLKEERRKLMARKLPRALEFPWMWIKWRKGGHLASCSRG